jgi:hypothetical protein
VAVQCLVGGRSGGVGFAVETPDGWGVGELDLATTVKSDRAYQARLASYWVSVSAVVVAAFEDRLEPR